MVVVRFDGAALGRLTIAAPWDAGAPVRYRLEVDELRYLLRLKGSGSVDPASAEDVRPSADEARDLMAALDDFGLLVERPTDDVRRGGDPGSSPRPASLPPGDVLLRLRLPVVYAVGQNTFDAFDHDGGKVVALGPEELASSTSFCSPRTVEQAFDEQQTRLGAGALGRDAHEDLTRTLLSAGLLEVYEPGVTATNQSQDGMRTAMRAAGRLRGNAAAAAAAFDASESDRVRAGHSPRAKLVAVQVAGNVPPLSTGMVLAAVRAAADRDERLAEAFDLRPRWIVDAADAPAPSDQACIYLFTNYLWSHEQNLDFAKAVKANDPRALTLHGGPDCPTYPHDTARYLAQNPQVDIMVRGEGEATAAELFKALAPTIGRPEGPDMSALREVPGITFRLGDEIVRTEDRPRMTDVNEVPSPFLTGIFDVFGVTRDINLAIIETNRGCPYGCTFCDWGSATNSRIRQFDIERVFAEFEWCARNEVERVFLADANFGIFARDIEIAKHMVRLKREYGFPKRLITNYAKNTVKHLRQIVEILAEGDVLSEGLLSLQTMDASTLSAIRRSNIKTEKYEALAKEFHEANMPLFVDLMLGLPGQTVASFRRDLQACVDREVNAKVHTTELLVNSPMNDPAYREEHRITTSRPPGATGLGAAVAARSGPALVVSSATFSRDEYRDMDVMRRSYLLLENFGVMRHVTRFVRSETGIPEVELMETLREAVAGERGRWPALASTLLAVPNLLAPPVSWAFYIDELRSFLTSRVGVEGGSALETVLAVQHAVLPAPLRSLPQKIELDHDYPRWYHSVMKAKDDGHLHDWEAVVGRLRDLGPVTIEVDDPHGLTDRNLGVGTTLDPYQDWELQSPVARAMPAHYREN